MEFLAEEYVNEMVEEEVVDDVWCDSVVYARGVVKCAIDAVHVINAAVKHPQFLSKRVPHVVDIQQNDPETSCSTYVGLYSNDIDELHDQFNFWYLVATTEHQVHNIWSVTQQLYRNTKQHSLYKLVYVIPYVPEPGVTALVLSHWYGKPADITYKAKLVSQLPDVVTNVDPPEPEAPVFSRHNVTSFQQALDMVESVASRADSDTVLASALPQHVPLDPYAPECLHYATLVMMGDDWINAIAVEDAYAPWVQHKKPKKSLLKDNSIRLERMTYRNSCEPEFERVVYSVINAETKQLDWAIVVYSVKLGCCPPAIVKMLVQSPPDDEKPSTSRVEDAQMEQVDALPDQPQPQTNSSSQLSAVEQTTSDTRRSTRLRKRKRLDLDEPKDTEDVVNTSKSSEPIKALSRGRSGLQLSFKIGNFDPDCMEPEDTIAGRVSWLRLPESVNCDHAAMLLYTASLDDYSSYLVSPVLPRKMPDDWARGVVIFNSSGYDDMKDVFIDDYGMWAASGTHYTAYIVDGHLIRLARLNEKKVAFRSFERHTDLNEIKSIQFDFVVRKERRVNRTNPDLVKMSYQLMWRDDYLVYRQNAGPGRQLDPAKTKGFVYTLLDYEWAGGVPRPLVPVSHKLSHMQVPLVRNRNQEKLSSSILADGSNFVQRSKRIHAIKAVKVEESPVVDQPDLRWCSFGYLPCNVETSSYYLFAANMNLLVDDRTHLITPARCITENQAVLLGIEHDKLPEYGSRSLFIDHRGHTDQQLLSEYRNVYTKERLFRMDESSLTLVKQGRRFDATHFSLDQLQQMPWDFVLRIQSMHSQTVNQVSMTSYQWVTRDTYLRWLRVVADNNGKEPILSDYDYEIIEFKRAPPEPESAMRPVPSNGALTRRSRLKGHQVMLDHSDEQHWPSNQLFVDQSLRMDEDPYLCESDPDDDVESNEGDVQASELDRNVQVVQSSSQPPPPVEPPVYALVRIENGRSQAVRLNNDSMIAVVSEDQQNQMVMFGLDNFMSNALASDDQLDLHLLTHGMADDAESVVPELFDYATQPSDNPSSSTTTISSKLPVKTKMQHQKRGTLSTKLSKRLPTREIGADGATSAEVNVAVNKKSVGKAARTGRRVEQTPVDDDLTKCSFHIDLATHLASTSSTDATGCVWLQPESWHLGTAAGLLCASMLDHDSLISVVPPDLVPDHLTPDAVCLFRCGPLPADGYDGWCPSALTGWQDYAFTLDVHLNRLQLSGAVDRTSSQTLDHAAFVIRCYAPMRCSLTALNKRVYRLIPIDAYSDANTDVEEDGCCALVCVRYSQHQQQNVDMNVGRDQVYVLSTLPTDHQTGITWLRHNTPFSVNEAACYLFACTCADDARFTLCTDKVPVCLPPNIQTGSYMHPVMGANGRLVESPRMQLIDAYHYLGVGWDPRYLRRIVDAPFYVDEQGNCHRLSVSLDSLKSKAEIEKLGFHFVIRQSRIQHRIDKRAGHGLIKSFYRIATRDDYLDAFNDALQQVNNSDERLWSLVLVEWSWTRPPSLLPDSAVQRAKAQRSQGCALVARPSRGCIVGTRAVRTNNLPVNMFLLTDDLITWLRPPDPVDVDSAAFYLCLACHNDVVSQMEPARLPVGWQHAGFICLPYETDQLAIAEPNRASWRRYKDAYGAWADLPGCSTFGYVIDKDTGGVRRTMRLDRMHESKLPLHEFDFTVRYRAKRNQTMSILQREHYSFAFRDDYVTYRRKQNQTPFTFELVYYRWFGTPVEFRPNKRPRPKRRFLNTNRSVNQQSTPMYNDVPNDDQQHSQMLVVESYEDVEEQPCVE